jgi:hypothetical protein
VARVTFGHDEIEPPLTSAWTARGDDFVRALASPVKDDWMHNASMRLGFPGGRAWVSTLRASSAAALFDRAAFPWWAQGQVVLLSRPDGAPPSVCDTTLRDLGTDDWALRAMALRDAGVLGVMRPGVDGDLAGVLSLDAAFDASFVAALAESARAEAIAFEEAPEPGFVASF